MRAVVLLVSSSTRVVGVESKMVVAMSALGGREVTRMWLMFICDVAHKGDAQDGLVISRGMTVLLQWLRVRVKKFTRFYLVEPALFRFTSRSLVS